MSSLGPSKKKTIFSHFVQNRGLCSVSSFGVCKSMFKLCKNYWRLVLIPRIFVNSVKLKYQWGQHIIGDKAMSLPGSSQSRLTFLKDGLNYASVISQSPLLIVCPSYVPTVSSAPPHALGRDATPGAHCPRRTQAGRPLRGEAVRHGLPTVSGEQPPEEEPRSTTHVPGLWGPVSFRREEVRGQRTQSLGHGTCPDGFSKHLIYDSGAFWDQGKNKDFST